MQRKLLFKLVAIAVLSILLLIPLAMIEGQIQARSARQAGVTRNIAESAAGPQVLTAPLIAVRYRERVERRGKDDSGRDVPRTEVVEHVRHFPAQRIELGGDLHVESLKRGLYSARLFHLSATLSGNAEVPARLGLESAQLIDARASLVMGVTDPRGINDDPEIIVNGASRRWVTGSAGMLAGAGVHVPLGEVDLVAGSQYTFSIPLSVSGLERLAIAPTANATKIKLASNWPHPSFQGRFLPKQRTVGDKGFEATWQVSHLARNFDRAMQAGGGSEAPAMTPGGAETIGINLLDPVNVYLTSERAVKYGVLFIVLTFAAFFLTEILRDLPIHPLQYLFVGLALAIFFLLLIALSEHVDFLIAYAVSSAACVTLIGTYLAGALGSRMRGMAFAAGVSALYGVLYGVLLSEDNALLMGTLLLFFALGSMMLATRGIDWYQLGQQNGATG